jgi:hypothetical protein
MSTFTGQNITGISLMPFCTESLANNLRKFTGNKYFDFDTSKR